MDTLRGDFIASNGSGAFGDQVDTMYFRTNAYYAWYINGAHSDISLDPGSGGSVLATLTNVGTSTTVTGVFRAQSFTATSDRNQKTNFAPVDAKAVLEKVAGMPITSWTYKTEADSGVRHIGPAAQDFRQAFEFGYDDKSIATVDADGVALAAIQGLYAELKDRDATIAAQASQIAAQAGQITALRHQVSELVAVQEDVKVMKAALVELLREHSEPSTPVRFVGAALFAH